VDTINDMWNPFKPKKGRQDDSSKTCELSADALTKSADGSRCCWQWYSNREFRLGWSLVLVAVILVWAVAARAQVQPLGNPPPPTGTQWVPVLDDEFANDTSINTNLWNGAAGSPSGGAAFCNIPFAATDPNFLGDGLGPQKFGCQNTFGTPGVAPYATIIPGEGLAIQDFNSLPVNGVRTDNWMGVQSIGKFTVQPNEYVEVSYKLPTDNAGEGDGLHPDIWLTVPQRTVFGPPYGNTAGCQDEVDLAEAELPSTAGFSIFDNNVAALVDVPESDFGTLSSSGGVVGAEWSTGGGAQGQISGFFNGSPLTGTTPISDSCWSGGAFIFAGWLNEGVLIPQTPPFFPGANNPTANTSNNDPLIIKYVRVWQAQTISGTPTPPPPPTPTPTPPPTSTCSVSIASPVSGSTVSSQFTVKLTQSGCGMNFNRLQVSAPGFSDHYDFSGTSNTLNLPANTYSISDSAWSDNTYLGQIGASGTSFVTITDSGRQAGGKVP
jgi:hypothetical protein